jgi:8-oxo-dGTP pyrophosphatase MutT (NUDIX family)
VLFRSGGGLSLLFIERAEHPGDPWSGHLAFPGGRVEAQDADPRGAAQRETAEETGLDLGRAAYLGQLDDLTGANLPVLVSGFVYHLLTPTDPLALSSEVRQAFWKPLEELLEPARQVERTFDFRGAQRRFAAIDLLGPGRPVLWGITYRFVSHLLALLGHPLAPIPPASRDVVA